MAVVPQKYHGCTQSHTNGRDTHSGSQHARNQAEAGRQPGKHACTHAHRLSPSPFPVPSPPLGAEMLVSFTHNGKGFALLE